MSFLKLLSMSLFTLFIMNVEGKCQQEEVEREIGNTGNYVDISEGEIDNYVPPMKSSTQDLRGSTTFWASYMFNTANNFIQSSYDVINFMTRNPRQTIVIGLYLACHVAAAVTFEQPEFICCMTPYNNGTKMRAIVLVTQEMWNEGYCDKPGWEFYNCTPNYTD